MNAMKEKRTGVAEKKSPRPQRYHHGNLKEALVAEAGRMLAASGLAPLSLRELARQVGVTQTAIYRHFPDKQGLLAEVAMRGFDELARRMAAARGENDLTTGFHVMGEIYIGFALENRELFKLMFGPQLRSHSDAPLCSDSDEGRLCDKEEGPFAILKATLAEGIAAGLFVDRDPELLAVAAWAHVHGLATIVLDRLVGDMPEEDLGGLVAGALEIFSRGLERPTSFTPR
jgi:AcrR family transcriptional regulator